MSDLENSAKPILAPLMDGGPMTLNARSQAIAAIWVVKTSMLFEHILDASAAYWTADERALFADAPHAIPGETVVRIAGYGGTQLSYLLGGATQLSHSTGIGKGFRATLIVGRVILQVESDRWKEATGRMGLWWPPAHAARSEWIFPCVHKKVGFPPGQPLDDEALREFANAGAGVTPAAE